MFTWTFNDRTGLARLSAARAAVSGQKHLRLGTNQANARIGAAPNPHLAARRAQALRSMFSKLSSWFGSRRDALYIGEINEYLSQASNVTDLEQRIRVIEQQRHFS